MQKSFEPIDKLEPLEPLTISSSTENYTVIIGNDVVNEVVKKYPEAIYLIDDFFDACLALPKNQCISIHADEETKSLERISEVIIQLKQLGVNRSTHLVAIGGGCIQDIATFAASIYMRGITWSFMPTTLLSMVDSCIGGKSSINVAGCKNLVGNFYPPQDIIIDVNFTQTLDPEQIIGGLFEAEKICYARGSAEYTAYLFEQPHSQIDADALHRITYQSLQAKKWFIEIDEFDKKERLLLNFGHTFGHAIEAGTNFAVSHGIAVGLGMLIAAYYSKQQNLINKQAMHRIDQLITHIKTMLQSIVLIQPNDININLFLKKFEDDKKHQADCYRMVCPTGHGDLALITAPKNHATQLAIKTAYLTALTDIGWDFKHSELNQSKQQSLDYSEN